MLANAAVAWASLAVLAFAEEGADPEQSAQRLTSGGGAGVVLRFAGFYGPDSPQTRQLISLGAAAGRLFRARPSASFPPWHTTTQPRRWWPR